MAKVSGKPYHAQKNNRKSRKLGSGSGVVKAKRVKGSPKVKSKGLHPNNLHSAGYNFFQLSASYPNLKPFVRPTPYGQDSIDFADPKAVKALNSALLSHYYQIKKWDIPLGFLCPPIPGRVDYIHYIADLLTQDSPIKRKKVRLLDIGTGANGIYPILGIQCYRWRFVASDIDPLAIANVEQIIADNPQLKGKLETRLQPSSNAIFSNIIADHERFDLTLCNPPFHASLKEASAGSERKRKNLAQNRADKGHKTSVKNSDELNFGGQKAELWCEGGEIAFLQTMIAESKQFANQCLWFTSLVSKKDNLKPCYKALEQLGAAEVKTIDMAQGNKLTRILAWSFLSTKQRQLWHKYVG